MTARLRITELVAEGDWSSPAGLAFVRRHENDAERAWRNEWNPRWMIEMVRGIRPTPAKIRAAWLEAQRSLSVGISSVAHATELPSDPRTRRACLETCEIFRQNLSFDDIVRLRVTGQDELAPTPHRRSR